jgi:hypothetical protein
MRSLSMDTLELSTNGFVPLNTQIAPAPLEPLENEQAREAKKTKRNRNSYCDVEINLDAGANHVKGLVKYGDIEQMIHFPSRARIVEGDISPDNIGNFCYGGTNYASGKSADYYRGEWLEAKEGNKVDYLDVWFLAALTHAKKVLLEATKKRYRSSGSIKLRCWVRLLTLSKERKGEIEKILNGITAFTFNNCEYEITLGALEVYTEGYGSAVSAWRLDETTPKVNILDMGGGTLSFTSYSTDFGDLDEQERTIADCGGINAIVGALQLGMSTRDNAGVQLYPELLEKALRTSKPKTILYDFGADISNIYTAFTSAMSDWLRINPQVQQVLKTVRFALINGEKVYLTGGGFSSTAIREYITDYLLRANGVGTKSKRKKSDEVLIDKELIVSLDNGHTLNITGLKSLGSLIPQPKKKGE